LGAQWVALVSTRKDDWFGRLTYAEELDLTVAAAVLVVTILLIHFVT